jgi:uncharacterized protein (DUF779 family)
MTPSVLATPEAQEKIERLQEKHGQLAFFQAGTCADAGALKCLTRAELLPEERDVKLGTVGGAPVFVDGEVYEGRGGRPALVIDVAPGPAEGFSLEHLEDFHFVSRLPAPAGEERPEAGRSKADRL